MWYNGVPHPYEDSFVATVIVWKDYNCQDWKNIDVSNERSTLSTAKKSLINAEISKMTKGGIVNDVWGTTFTMMNNFQDNTEFSSGGYTVIMSQGGSSSIYWRICRVGNNFFNSLIELGFNAIFTTKISKFYTEYIGYFILFQTRWPEAWSRSFIICTFLITNGASIAWLWNFCLRTTILSSLFCLNLLIIWIRNGLWRA